jgi:hypothetical protein
MKKGIGFNLTAPGYKGVISPGKKIIYGRKIFFSGRKKNSQVGYESETN